MNPESYAASSATARQLRGETITRSASFATWSERRGDWNKYISSDEVRDGSAVNTSAASTLVRRNSCDAWMRPILIENDLIPSSELRSIPGPSLHRPACPSLRFPLSQIPVETSWRVRSNGSSTVVDADNHAAAWHHCHIDHCQVDRAIAPLCAFTEVSYLSNSERDSSMILMTLARISNRKPKSRMSLTLFRNTESNFFSNRSYVYL